MAYTLLQTIKATGGFSDLTADDEGNVVEVNYGNGPYLTRFSDDGTGTTVLGAQPGYFGAGRLTLLADGRYLATSGTGYPFGNERGVSFQIFNADGSAATEAKTLYPPEVGVDNQSQAYSVTATADGGFSIVFTDVTHRDDQFTVTFPQTSDFPHTSEPRSAGQDVYSQHFDATATATGGWVVTSDRVDSVEGGTANRRVYDQSVFDSTTLANGKVAYVYYDQRHEGSNSVYGGAEVFTQLSLTIDTPGQGRRAIRVDDNPLHQGGPNGDLNNNQEISGASGATIVALKNGTLAVIWEENSYVRDDSVFGHFRFDGRDAYVRYFDANGNALTDPTVFLHRGTDLGNISSYVWAEALPDGRIAVAYMDGIYGVNGNGEVESYLGTLGPLGSGFETQRISPDAANGQFYGVRDLVVRSDGTLDVVIDQSGGGFPPGSRPNGTYIDHYTFGYGVDGQVKGGSDGANRLNGGTGGDLLAAYAGDDVVHGNAGDDTAYGNEGKDALYGDAGNDKLFGNEGDDILEGGAGADDLRGGDGIDLVSYAGSARGVRVNLATGAVKGGDATHDVFQQVEGIVGSAKADRLTGDDGANVLDGGAGRDILTGGKGDDLYYVDIKSDKVAEKVDEGSDTIVASFSYDLRNIANIENLTITGGAKTATGSDGNNVINGDALANVIKGLGGDDTISGGDGNDALYSGTGGFETLNGGAGDDRLYSTGSGSVRADGGSGDDSYYIEGNNTTVIEAAGGGDDVVRVLSGNFDGGGDAEIETILMLGDGGYVHATSTDNLIIGNSGGNWLTGEGGNDTIRGGGGGDALDGGDGDDILTGGAGLDNVRGGAGVDTYIFADGDTGATNDTADRILDFSQSDGDHIALYGIDANAATPAIDVFRFVGTKAFSKAGDLHYVQIDGNTYLSGDTDGDKQADFTIRLDGLIDLTKDDLILRAPAGGFAGVTDQAFGADAVTSAVGGGVGLHASEGLLHVMLV